VDETTILALRARRGDAAAAAAFVRATQADVWRLCAALGSRDTADDLTQEAYARAFGSLHRFEGRAAARTWLLTIARRVCADAIRSATRDRSAARERTAAAHQPDPPRDHAESVALRAVLAGLADDRREAFVLTQLVGLSYAEVAEVCGCPVGTIRSRVARARADLINAIDGPQSASGTG
jgi:RNA polymerase sigma-70 factor (ECF subfamily)